MPGPESFRKKKPTKSRNGMNIILRDRIGEPDGLTSQFCLSPVQSGRVSRGEQQSSRLSHEKLDAFLVEDFDDTDSAYFMDAPAELPRPKAEKDLAAGVLKQAARDLRRYRAATKGAKRELYLDAYSWINDYDFSWPYSFVNVCELFDVCPEIIRAELLSDASLSPLHYWTRRMDRLSKKLKSSFVRVFASCSGSEVAETRPLASCI
jgi:hypothetical protein